MLMSKWLGKALAGINKRNILQNFCGPVLLLADFLNKKVIYCYFALSKSLLRKAPFLSFRKLSFW